MNNPQVDTTKRNTMLGAALYYARQGFKIFPLKPKCKEPLTAHGFKDATQLQVTVREYWQQYPQANIGIIRWVIKLYSPNSEAQFVEKGNKRQ